MKMHPGWRVTPPPSAGFPPVGAFILPEPDSYGMAKIRSATGRVVLKPTVHTGCVEMP